MLLRPAESWAKVLELEVGPEQNLQVLDQMSQTERVVLVQLIVGGKDVGKVGHDDSNGIGQVTARSVRVVVVVVASGGGRGERTLEIGFVDDDEGRGEELVGLLLLEPAEDLLELGDRLLDGADLGSLMELVVEREPVHDVFFAQRPAENLVEVRESVRLLVVHLKASRKPSFRGVHHY